MDKHGRNEVPLEAWVILLIFVVATFIFGICVLLNQYGIFSGAWFK